jgi:peptidoglycan/xylan/chitin deacetylase (PgdA/CDA1 family)
MRFRVALTFDAEHADRPAAPSGTRRVLDELAAHRVVASFFIQGRWAQAHPADARSIVEGGHLVGNHSHAHARMPDLRPSALDRDVRAAERAIVRATGADPRPWFRCPFGVGTRDPSVLGRLERLGYRETGWDVDPGDWRAAATGAGVTRDVVDGALAHGDGAVVLLHPWSRATGLALPAIIDRLREAGADFVRLDAFP